MTDVANTFFFEWEQSLILWIQQHLGTFGTTVASFFSFFGESLVMVIVLGFLYWCWDKEIGKKAGLIIIFAHTLNCMSKNIFRRKRPYMDNKEILCLKPVEKSADIYDIAAQGFSFPSGHATNSVTVFSSCALYLKEQKWVRVTAVILPLLCGISRFCLGVHYPTDVLCGWLLGLITFFLVSFLQSRAKNNWVLYICLLILSSLGIFWCRSNDYYSSLGMLYGFVLASAFEEKYVKFDNTRNIFQSILRIIGGGIIFFGLNTILKLPFSTDFLDNSSMLSFFVRAARYAIVVFVDMGVYPLLFRYMDRLLSQKKKN